ncbi:SDR family oxidoreductase [uncultured Desulfobacter sp.]|uniref:SDR family oxidoreductase n=1 Tax=uncultured Desulfobacter sp. TaxID=240139 RepID=UPI0029F50D2A|nr:SDR family oxidoreductase [uncultured Desulfobacter sp.]
MPYPQRSELFCDDLPTRPVAEKGLILVTGASGYIGGRLVPELIARGYRVRVLVRSHGPSYGRRWPGAEIMEGDALCLQDLKRAMDQVHTAYYLMHSLLIGRKRFQDLELAVAKNFRQAAGETDVERIIYLGGLGDKNDSLSAHLKSRLEVARELMKGPVPVTAIRAAVIIGSGSASFEIIKNLVARIPVICLPSYAKTLCQPIGIRDVIKYLVGCLEHEKTRGREFDIGGNEILSYENMMKVVADILGKRRWFTRLPLPLNAFSFLASFITPVPAPITRSLLEGLGNEVVCRNEQIQALIPFEPLPFREAVKRAMQIEEDDAMQSRWSCAYPPTWKLVPQLDELAREPHYISRHWIHSSKLDRSLFYAFCRIGGKEGWFHNNWMWFLRGEIDRLLLGVGMSRGRRSQSELWENDVIDFFRVEKLEPYRRLLLRAEMKLPGKAWLEFTVTPENPNLNRIIVTAYFEPRGIWGHLYWYFFLPFHYLIFTRLLQAIDRQSRSREREISTQHT